MRVPTPFTLLALAASISTAAALGFGASRSAYEAYEQGLSISYSLNPFPAVKGPASTEDQDLSGMRPTFVFAVIPGRGLTSNVRHDPWSAAEPLLSNYTYTPLPSMASDDVLRSVLVRVPEALWEMESLMLLIHKHALIYVIDDHSGQMHLGNVRHGLAKGYTSTRAAYG